MDDFDLITPLLEPARQAAHLRRAADAHRPPEAGSLAAEALARQGHTALAGDLLEKRGERIAPFVKGHEEFAADYQATPALLVAANVALSLGRPLLLTGEPGSGKTLAAYWLAHVLDLGEVLVFHVKSESRARDLLYTFDAAAWFRESAIDNKKLDKAGYLTAGPLGKAFGWNHDPEKTTAVLIDEIDKAPRDFPNDLLHELDQMTFEVFERAEGHARRMVACPPKMRPVVVITSNSERQLPPPFLRRCVMHKIELDKETVIKILTIRLQEFGTPEEDLVIKAAKFWTSLPSGSTRKPTIDEFWRWLALAKSYGGWDLAELAAALSEPKDSPPPPFIATLFSSNDVTTIFGRAEP